MLQMVIENLLNPAVLFFVLGMVAVALGSNFTFPKALGETLSLYLLIAIGLKGGIELSQFSITEVTKPILGTIFLGTLTPILTLIYLRKIVKLDTKNAIALAATYGSVSIVTYGAAAAFLENRAINYEAFMNAMVVLMEIPAILIALVLLEFLKGRNTEETSVRRVGIVAPAFSFKLSKEQLRECFLGKSILLLAGSLVIGMIIGLDGKPLIQPLFIDLYPSMLTLFLLNMGLIAGQRLAVVRKHGLKLLSFALIMPIVYGVLGVFVGMACGLSVGGATLMGVLAASASYIAAPAAMSASVPDANPSIYLGLALGITFPFNLTLGIPIFYSIAQWLY
ncbi:sodium-dependent bicarbonate transport family permease [Alkalihalobacterium sp. APHAB7]|uniref:sodium-dependent bicarbonate transport family permease n=1 Tax=Alkalihalobacterium sp. APHAB7 TaxID=3402081 RepID=UPI003AAE43D8